MAWTNSQSSWPPALLWCFILNNFRLSCFTRVFRGRWSFWCAPLAPPSLGQMDTPPAPRGKYILQEGQCRVPQETVVTLDLASGAAASSHALCSPRRPSCAPPFRSWGPRRFERVLSNPARPPAPRTLPPSAVVVVVAGRSRPALAPVFPLPPGLFCTLAFVVFPFLHYPSACFLPPSELTFSFKISLPSPPSVSPPLFFIHLQTL